MGSYMWTARNEVRQAIQLLKLSAEEIIEVPAVEAAATLRHVRERFVQHERVLFWWEHFVEGYEAYSPPTEDAYQLVPQVAPAPEEPAWLLAGLTDDESAVFECAPRLLPAL